MHLSVVVSITYSKLLTILKATSAWQNTDMSHNVNINGEADCNFSGCVAPWQHNKCVELFDHYGAHPRIHVLQVP